LECFFSATILTWGGVGSPIIIPLNVK